MMLGALGTSYELCGQQLFPIGTVYDPFVCRGLDALIYSLYVGSKMIFAGVFEIGWAVGLKYSRGFTQFWPSVATVVSMVVSCESSGSSSPAS